MVQTDSDGMRYTKVHAEDARGTVKAICDAIGYKYSCKQHRLCMCVCVCVRSYARNIYINTVRQKYIVYIITF